MELQWKREWFPELKDISDQLWNIGHFHALIFKAW